MSHRVTILTTSIPPRVYRTHIPTILAILHYKLDYELSSPLLDMYSGTLQHALLAERRSTVDNLYYEIECAVTTMGYTKIHNVVNVGEVHYKIYWS